jgi:hypothetical protein
MKIKLYMIFLLLCTVSAGFSQTNSQVQDTTKKPNAGKAFGMIYGGFYDKMARHNKPKSGFEVKTGILGYKNQLAGNVDATIMFDVSKTTREIKSDNDSVNITYTEGNNYTAYLKEADIHWKIKPYAEFTIGMLLSSQYLLLQDKFWGHRYIEYTFQEVNKYGSPADFGARLKLNPTKKISVTFNVLNGEGPARWQDDKSKFLFTGDIEFRNTENQVFRIYADYKQPSSSALNVQSVINAFAGIGYKKFRFGADYSLIHNVNYSSSDVWGCSGYVIYKMMEKVELLCRYDSYEDIVFYDHYQFMLAGLQYEPAKNYFLSLNFRELLPDKTSTIYLNFGAKF